MSRLGIRPVQIPQGVKVNVSPTLVKVEGPKGKLEQSYDPTVEIAVKDGAVHVNRTNDSKQAKSFHGLYRQLVNNMVIGVSEGFKKALVVNGVGYRAEVQGKLLVLSLGYSTDFKQHRTRLDDRSPIFRLAFSLTHTSFQGNGGDRFMREHTDV